MGENDALLQYLDFIKRYEGFKDTVYLDGNGIPTIGYGFTDPLLIKKGKITREEADKILGERLLKEESILSNSLPKWDMLGNSAKTALVSYRYNYPAGFKDTTKFSKYWNKGDYYNAIKQIDAGWNDKKNPGLRVRRMAEQELLNNDPYLNPTVNAFKKINIHPIDALKVNQIIPEENTRRRWDGVDPSVSPYLTGNLLLIKPRTEFPTVAETVEQNRWVPNFNITPRR